ncbi:MAG TPA: hypothetical protein VF918_07600 [Anaerolineales bacterium]
MLFRMLAIGLGVLHVYAAIKSQSMNADGISYLDIGDAYFRADWVNAINPVWSPLYSWILGLVNFLVRPPMEWEFPVVHMINLLIYMGTLASFEFLWEKIRWSHAPAVETKTVQMPDWLWWVLGYLLFIWITLSLIEMWSVTPDMLMASFVFLAAGLIAQIRAGDANFRNFLYLGLVLSLGYLSKTFMFAMALVFLAISIIVIRRKTNSLPYVLGATGIFILISLPFILLISEKKGKFTIGEAGTVTYVRYVNGIPFPHWQGDPIEGIVPTHLSRMVHQSPAVYEFGEPVGGTYPISTDPSFWYEGIEPRFDFGGLLGRLSASGVVYAELFLQRQGIFFACVLALYMMGQRQKYPFEETLRRWALVIPAVVAFGLYATVLVEDRYVGAFILLFWADILANIQVPDLGKNRSWLKSLGLIASIGLMANIVIFNLNGFNRLNQSLEAGVVEPVAAPARPLAVAQSLRDLGLKTGDKVGVIGYAYDSFWARLARVKIVSEMLETDAVEYWASDNILQQSVLQAFAGTGAKAVIAEYVPDYAQLKDWHRVGDSNYYIYVFGE